jgi:hypothetical protein
MEPGALVLTCEFFYTEMSGLCNTHILSELIKKHPRPLVSFKLRSKAAILRLPLVSALCNYASGSVLRLKPTRRFQFKQDRSRAARRF